MALLLLNYFQSPATSFFWHCSGIPVFVIRTIESGIEAVGLLTFLLVSHDSHVSLLRFHHTTYVAYSYLNLFDLGFHFLIMLGIRPYACMCGDSVR
jgi:formate-dependent nitrite reductase membrane component NrfD